MLPNLEKTNPTFRGSTAKKIVKYKSTSEKLKDKGINPSDVRQELLHRMAELEITVSLNPVEYWTMDYVNGGDKLVTVPVVEMSSIFRRELKDKYGSKLTCNEISYLVDTMHLFFQREAPKLAQDERQKFLVEI